MRLREKQWDIDFNRQNLNICAVGLVRNVLTWKKIKSSFVKALSLNKSEQKTLTVYKAM